MKIEKKAKEKSWSTRFLGTPEETLVAGEISRALGINLIIAKLLYSRGYTDPKSAASFIRMENEIFRNPFDMKDMEPAVKRINKAVRCGEKITIFGDYDVDGVTSVCTLYLYLKSRGARVEYYIPNRAGEGYGVSTSAIDAIKENGTSLIITVDTGITAIDEVLYAKSIGIDFVVTDHHECHGDLPKAEAVVNPHRHDCPYPFKELAGVGVVFKLLCAYEEKFYANSRLNATLNVIREFADLVSIGTIADVMPIKEENRIIVKYGLSMIEKTERAGLRALIDVSTGSRPNERSRRRKKAKITSSFIGFTIAPRINAAGRVRSATEAVELFLEDDYSRALTIAEELCEANRERQAEENKIMLEAYEKINALDIDKNPVIVLNADDWHHGVIGIVSSRITEKYCRPSILVSFEGNDTLGAPDNIGKGSGRSIKGLNLVEALCHCGEKLVKFGGHELAAGLSVTRDNLPAFIEMINEYARENLSPEDMLPSIEADMEIPFDSINLALAEGLSKLEPFGVGNPVPLFIIREVNVCEISGFSDNKHTKLVLTNGSHTVGGICFSHSPESLGVYVNDKTDILFSIDVSEWQDRKSIQLIIRDIHLSSSQRIEDTATEQRYLEVHDGATFTKNEDIIPEREDFVAVYKIIQAAVQQHQDVISHRDLMSRASMLSGRTIGYIKLKFMIMIFREMNILSIEELPEEKYRFKLHYSSTKKDIEKSGILRKLRMQMR